FNVVPNLPNRIRHLHDIAVNLWYSWNWPAVQLFIRLDAETWEQNRQNLVRMLGRMSPQKLEKIAQDSSFVANLDRVWLMLQSYLNMKTWCGEVHREETGFNIAYFSMEFGLDVSLPIYSGGLGILSGDHLKSSSDLGLPLVGIGLLYQQGYFQQTLNSNGWQEEHYPVNDWYNMPVTLQRDAEGRPLTIAVELAGETLQAHIWRVTIGRNPLFLLDSNISENPPHLRQITDQLYGGDREKRLRQEILLGIGGMRALRALNIKPSVYHMNEGHSAFLALERLRRMIVEDGAAFHEARELVWATNVFTTHTPVPAGNEVFDPALMKRYFMPLAGQLRLTWDEFLRLGQIEGETNSQFSLTVLALKLSAHCNGVSQLHGGTSRRMWSGLWPTLPEPEIPIGAITNGIHTRTWISHDLDETLERYIGPQFYEEPHNIELWDRVDRVPDVELWRIHQIRKERLIFFARKVLKRQLSRRGAGYAELKNAEEVLSSDALTIGFARRFAPYKRADMLIHDPDRLRRLLADSVRPVQFIIAGKAHPQDKEGKEIIRELVHFAGEPTVRHKFAFLEDYDMNVAKYMVQGVDVWLSTPRRPLEASGTSGMKAAANGALNVCTLDGWWAEAYTPEVGWAIGSGQTYEDTELQDKIEAEAYYDLLEKEVLPLFYDRDRTDLPRRWIAMMKESMKKIGGYFNTHRMVMEYCERYYIP
ncbi:MAG: alpha-glucan family phosphorylase, partial [Calditrichota bacterium]